ncbi:DUF1615 domain-containing protein [Chitinolyticbacter albus]|uniref:DUF1615 domain-containing protein n=1 Tax=Chitinolyticbacter albus TaxID=2961951 RepID=UPI00210BC14C|nr:DUF1615 domain-containing protein [Chitinolyticbacter albus]
MPRACLALTTLLLATACATSSPPPAPQPPTASVASEAAASMPASVDDITSDASAVTASVPVEAAVPTPPPATPAKPRLTEAQGRVLLNQLLPAKMPDRAGWSEDIIDAFTALKLPYTAELFCAAAATIEQESTWQGDPVVPGLPAIVWKAIDAKAGRYHVPLSVVKTALLKPSPTGQSYKTRIDNLRTEREMNDLFEDMAREARNLSLPLNMANPIRTGGPMQVSVEFAQNHVRVWPYPYPRRGSIRQEVFTRRGGAYFGIANLLHYPAPYDAMIYRFADYNAGRYASRNVAFQRAVSRLTGRELTEDGDLLRYQAGRPVGTSSVESALYTVAGRLKLSKAQIRNDLEQEKMNAFGSSETYKRVFAAADATAGKPLPRAALPQIRLVSPKITRKLTTEWFAKRVDWRYQTCLSRKP